MLNLKMSQSSLDFTTNRDFKPTTYLFHSAQNMWRIPGDNFSEFASSHTRGSLIISKQGRTVSLCFPNISVRNLDLDRPYRENDDWQIIPGVVRPRTLQLHWIYKNSLHRVATYLFHDRGFLSVEFKMLFGQGAICQEINSSVLMRQYKYKNGKIYRKVN